MFYLVVSFLKTKGQKEIIIENRVGIYSNTLRKSLQTTSASPYRIYVTDFVSSIYNLKAVL